MKVRCLYCGKCLREQKGLLMEFMWCSQECYLKFIEERHLVETEKQEEGEQHKLEDTGSSLCRLNVG